MFSWACVPLISAPAGTPRALEHLSKKYPQRRFFSLLNAKNCQRHWNSVKSLMVASPHSTSSTSGLLNLLNLPSSELFLAVMSPAGHLWTAHLLKREALRDCCNNSCVRCEGIGAAVVQLPTTVPADVWWHNWYFNPRAMSWSLVFAPLALMSRQFLLSCKCLWKNHNLIIYIC